MDRPAPSSSLPSTEAINGSEFANASERFVRAVETQGIRWQQADSISADLPYVARKSTSGNAWMADRADPDRSITAALAAIRAVWMASNPQMQTPRLVVLNPICRDFPLHAVSCAVRCGCAVSEARPPANAVD